MNSKHKYNFVVAKLGDNDFGHLIADAFSESRKYCEPFELETIEQWKAYIIRYVIGHSIINSFRISSVSPINFESIKDIESYLQRKLVVSFEVCKPLFDDDSGSAAYDLHHNYAWLL